MDFQTRVLATRDKHHCGLMQARDIVEMEMLHEDIDKASTIDDLKVVLKKFLYLKK